MGGNDAEGNKQIPSGSHAGAITKLTLTRFTAANLAAVLLTCLLAAPTVAEVQQPGRVWRVGIMSTSPRPAASPFLQELRNLGYIEGQNVIVEWRHTAGSIERRSREAPALMAWKPDVVVSITASDGQILHESDPSVPIVLRGVGVDLVRMGVVASLARPGGNITGIQILQDDTAPKRLLILKELLPHLQRVAVLHASSAISPAVASHNARLFDLLDATARTLSVRVHRYSVAPDDDLDHIFAEMNRDADAVMLDTTPYIWARRPQLAGLIRRYRLPIMYDTSDWLERSGLVSYGPNLVALWQRAAHFVDRILKGGKPADMPIEQPRNFELIINARTAKNLDLKIPQHLLLLADRIIE